MRRSAGKCLLAMSQYCNFLTMLNIAESLVMLFQLGKLNSETKNLERLLGNKPVWQFKLSYECTHLLWVSAVWCVIINMALWKIRYLHPTILFGTSKQGARNRLMMDCGITKHLLAVRQEYETIRCV